MIEILTVINSVILVLILGLLVRHDRQDQVKNGSDRQVLLDTSVLIDGRIAELGKTGFLNDNLLISRGVLNELQLLADGSDHEKRARARHGLDIIRELQEQVLVKITILDDSRSTPEGVDHRLLNLAREYGYWLCTIDYNLNKVAKVEGVSVLNINELAQSVRMAALPGEQLELKLTAVGQDKNQAVGYLEDGAMVVVAEAANRVGQTEPVIITKSLQTEAGKMMFAELVNKTSTTKQKPQASRQAAVKKTEPKKTTPKEVKKQQKAGASKNQHQDKKRDTKKRTISNKQSRNNHKTNRRGKKSIEDRLMTTIRNQK